MADIKWFPNDYARTCSVGKEQLPQGKDVFVRPVGPPGFIWDAVVCLKHGQPAQMSDPAAKAAQAAPPAPPANDFDPPLQVAMWIPASKAAEAAAFLSKLRGNSKW